jgi:hypothetical protein
MAKKKVKPPVKELTVQPVSFRCTDAEWRELDETARLNGRKLSAEARFRCFPPTMGAK